MFKFFTLISTVFLINQGGYCLVRPILKRLTDPVDHGEGPIWDNRTGLLYFVDIFDGKLLSYNLINSKLNSICFDGAVTTFVPSTSDPNLFLVAVNRSIIAVEWTGKDKVGQTKNLLTVSQQFPTSRFNDGKADKRGRLWFGTMGFESKAGVEPNKGLLYFITKCNLNNPSAVISPVNISNGLTWNKANNKFYYIDTPTLKVKEYDYDNESGKISNPRVVFDVSDHGSLNGGPDGMTIDKDDNLWIALYNGSSVIKVNPKTKKLLQQIDIPAQYVTSVIWGGPKFDILFVTTSKHALSENERLKQPSAGSVFAVTNLETHGFPTFTANIIDQI